MLEPTPVTVAPVYALDFDQVRVYGWGGGHRPTFPCQMLELATDASLRTCELVKKHQRFHHGQWYLPLYDAHVRAWLKRVRFTEQPLVSVGGVEMLAGQLVEE